MAWKKAKKYWTSLLRSLINFKLKHLSQKAVEKSAAFFFCGKSQKIVFLSV